MKLLKKLTIIALMCGYFTSSAQNTDQVKKKGPEDSYARSSISYLLLDFSNEKYSPMLKEAINTTRMPSKFDNNDLKKKVITAPYFHDQVFPNANENAKKIISTLTTEKYAIDIVKFWWNIKDNGNYSTDLIKARGEYNATDEDFNQAMATKVGRAKIADAGIKLIGNSYVLVMDYKDIKTMQEIYDAKDLEERKKAEKEKKEFVPVKRIKNGFVGKATAYLFQVNYPDTVQGYFNESFIDEKRIDITKLNQIFDNVYSPFKLVTTQSVDVDGTQPNPGQFLAPAVQKTDSELMVVLVNDGISKSLNSIENRVEAFRVKTPVTNVGPIRAKIGEKESLTHERRYFVWQYVSDNRDNVIAKKKGVIRARKVVNNKSDELGKTQESEFYQVAGGKVTEGMTLQEAKDLGCGLSLGGGSDGFVGRFDINIGQWINIPMKQWKLYFDLGASGKQLDAKVGPPTLNSTFPTSSSKFNSLKWSVGLAKEFPFMRNLHVGGYLGWGAETLKWKAGSDLSEQLLASGMQFGGRFGINLGTSSAQIIAAIDSHSYGTVTYKYTPEGGEEQSIETGNKWEDIFTDKQAISFSLSLRFNF
jgi:hypothetical protein